jgi:hypothetical protein
VLAGIAALAWVGERVSGEGNIITGLIQVAAPYFPWGILTLAVVSLPVFAWYRRRNKNSFA